MNAMSILGSNSPINPGEARHFTLHWAFQSHPTGDAKKILQRLKYTLQSPDGEILYDRNLSLMPEVHVWDIIIEIPSNYYASEVTLYVENEQVEGVRKTHLEIKVAPEK